MQRFDQTGNIIEQGTEDDASQAERIGGGLHRMQSQNRIVLGLREPVATGETVGVRIRGHALRLGDNRIAVLVRDEHIQQRCFGDIRLPADLGHALLKRRILDTDSRPVVQILAGSGVLGHGLQRGDGIIVEGLGNEFADGPAIEQRLDSAVGNHAVIVAKRRPKSHPFALTGNTSVMAGVPKRL